MQIDGLSAFLPSPDFLASYNHLVVQFSGGKDALATVLFLLQIGVPPDKIELHHHLVDGDSRTMMDWPITGAYCQAVANLLGVKLLLSYRQGGFEREMMRDGETFAPTIWQSADGTWQRSPKSNDQARTRLKFPEVTSRVMDRWCHRQMRERVINTLLVNDRRFLGAHTLVISGDRAEESEVWAKRPAFGPHRVDNRPDPFGGKAYLRRRYRHVDFWRPILHWSEDDVWEIIRMAGIVPHPAYQLGWPRLGPCRTCVFNDPDTWATIRAIYPATFADIAQREEASGATIRGGETVTMTADRGTPYPAALAQSKLAAFANQKVWTGQVFTNDWQMPAGAFTDKHGRC